MLIKTRTTTINSNNDDDEKRLKLARHFFLFLDKTRKKFTIASHHSAVSIFIFFFILIFYKVNCASCSCWMWNLRMKKGKTMKFDTNEPHNLPMKWGILSLFSIFFFILSFPVKIHLKCRHNQSHLRLNTFSHRHLVDEFENVCCVRCAAVAMRFPSSSSFSCLINAFLSFSASFFRFNFICLFRILRKSPLFLLQHDYRC